MDRIPVRLRRPARLLRLASDDRLVALVRAGEEGAFEALYDRHHPAILGFCRHMLGTREEAEDAVQHTFLAAFRDLARDDKPIELRPWLFAIARNRCVSLLRARRAHVAIELVEPATDGLAATVERREDVRELLADLSQLPENQRAALLLAELGALDHAGIAQVLGCPREKVKALVFQARSSLAASREARATPCAQIRVELSTASGGALRRGPLRRHLRTCDGCRAFKTEVAMQRKLLALALPVVPTVALKASVLSGGGAAGASTSSGAAVATGATTVSAASGTSGGTLGMLGTIASTGAGKLAVSLAVAGVVAGGGTLTEQLRHPRTGSAPVGARDVPGAHADGGLLRRAPDVLAPATVAAPAATRRAPASVTLPQVDGGSRPGEAPPRSSDTATPASPPPVHQSGGRPEASPRGGDATPPGHGESSGSPPAGQGSTPPGQGGTPPGQGGTPPGEGGTPPGRGAPSTPTPGTHVPAGDAPPRTGDAPGSSGSTPGNSGSTPGRAGDPPANAGTTPGRPSDISGHAGNAPADSGDVPGPSDDAPGNSGSTPGPSDDAPGSSGNAPGGPGNAPGGSGSASAPGHAG